jgi:signal transduction histidine kinase
LTISNPTQELVADLAGRAFERFYRGDSAHTRHVDGHGLGLSLCIEIVHLHHGRITLNADDKHVVHVSVKAPLVPPDTWVD